MTKHTRATPANQARSRSRWTRRQRVAIRLLATWRGTRVEPDMRAKFPMVRFFQVNRQKFEILVVFLCAGCWCLMMKRRTLPGRIAEFTPLQMHALGQCFRKRTMPERRGYRCQFCRAAKSVGASLTRVTDKES